MSFGRNTMDTRSESASTSSRRGHLVAAHRALSLRPTGPGCLTIHSGRAWVTLNQPQLPDGLRDHFLAAGQSMPVPAGTHLVMEPRISGEALRFDWCETRPVQAVPGRFAREVVAPSRELTHALGQVAVALAHLLRGVLGYAEFLVAGRGRVLSRFESNPP
jgi:hypothetical protein